MPSNGTVNVVNPVPGIVIVPVLLPVVDGVNTELNVQLVVGTNTTVLHRSLARV